MGNDTIRPSSSAKCTQIHIHTHTHTHIYFYAQKFFTNRYKTELECDTWYHRPRCQQCVSSWNLRIFKVATWHYGYRHHHKTIVFGMICYVVDHYATKVKLPILQQSNMACSIECGVRRSREQKVKPNLGCRSNIAITVFYVPVFVSSKYRKDCGVTAVLVPRWPSYPVIWIFDLGSGKILFFESLFRHV